jgi:hypothetical protein
MPHAQDENLIISLLLCFYVSRANASADFYRIVPSKFAVGAFSFRVQAKRNSEGAVHFVVNITSAKGADFPKDVEFSLDKVVEKDPFPMLSTMKKLGAVMDGNSAVCTFDAPNDSELSFILTEFFPVPVVDYYLLRLKDFMPTLKPEPSGG